MRLTLRNMMNYLHGNLQPEDEANIKQKIEENEAATKLLNLMREVTHRLGGPSGDETSLDPNTVAEYLDHAMPEDRVEGFEKLCLDSALQLAEVTSCHQILTRVLTEPAEVKPASRDRMYGLPELYVPQPEPEPEPQPEPQPAAESATSEAPTPPTKPTISRRDVKVPEYLRDSPRTRRLIAIGVLTIGLFVAIAIVAFNPFKKKTEVTEKPATVAEGPVSEEPKPAEKAAGPVAGAPAAGAPVAGGPVAGAPAAGPVAGAPAAGPVAGAPVAGGPVAGGPVAGGPVAGAPAAGPVAGAPAAGAPAAGPVAGGPVAGPVAGGPAAGPVAGGPAAGPAPGGAGDPGGALAGLPAPAGDARGAGLPPVGGVVPPPVVPPGGAVAGTSNRPAGRFMSDAQLKKVLLQRDPSGSWKRVKSQGSLLPNVPLIALPAYRCKITLLPSGVALQVLGGTRVELLPPVQGVAGLKIDYGRVLITPFGERTKLNLNLGGRVGTITFATANTEIGVEVKPSHSRGTDPERISPDIVTDLYVKSGTAIWNDPGIAQGITVQPNTKLVLQGQVTSGPKAEQLPKWCTQETVQFVDQRASKILEQAFSFDRTASVNLREMADDRRKEVRWLARRCMANINDFGPMVAALNDEAFERDWPYYRQEVLDGIARGPEQAAGVRQGVEKTYDRSDAGVIYRMLWGYTNEDLANGDDSTLVELLNHGTLAVRVLSFLNLKEITGMGLFYQPTQTEARRRQYIEKWRARLMAGAIRHKSTATAPSAAPAPKP